MSGIETETEESDWTKSNLQKLLVALKSSIPEQERMHTYTDGLETTDWQKIAFPPFSPEACQEKWGEILQEMRKIRTLTELIAEAEDAISNPVQDKTGQDVEEHQLVSEANNTSRREFSKQYQNLPKHTSGSGLKRKRVSEDNTEGKQCTEDADGLSAKPPFNGCFLYCVEQLASEFSKNGLLKVWAQRWRDLTEIKRQQYRACCEELKKHDWLKLNDFVMTLGEKEQQCIPNEQSTKKRQKLKNSDAQTIKEHTSEEISYRPSDSEDEDLEDSSNEKEVYLDLEEDEEEKEEEGEKEDDIMFEMYRW